MAQLIPVSELSDRLEEYTNNNIDWQLDPGPYIDSERIGLDVAATRRIMRVAGLGGVVLCSYFGEQSHIETNSARVTGINTDGSAEGTASVSTVKSATQRNLLSGDANVAYQCRWPVARVEINRNELASEISDDVVQRGMSREAAWARQTSLAIGAGLVDAARKNLIKVPLSDNIDKISQLLYALVITHSILETSASTCMTVAMLQATTAVNGLIANKLYAGESHPEKLRLSLFPWGFQPDRFAAAALMAKSCRLLRPIDAAKNE